VAGYADACNLFGTTPDDVARKLDVLRSHCDAEGRDYDGIEKTMLAVRPALADVDPFIAAAGDYAALGVTEIATTPDRARARRPRPAGRSGRGRRLSRARARVSGTLGRLRRVDGSSHELLGRRHPAQMPEPQDRQGQHDRCEGE
jgi:hypothetical protein